MPELPEVDTISKGLAKVLTNRVIISLYQGRAGLRSEFPAQFAARIVGKRIISVTRRAKFILMQLNSDEILVFHLGMSGRLLLCKAATAKTEKHDHLIFGFDNEVYLKFNDPRRFGLCDLVSSDDLLGYKPLKHLGIEPLGPKLTSEWLKEKLHGKKVSIKAALMDQHIIAGLGNIYVCEALFYSGISPERKAGDCSLDQISKLVPAIRSVLRKSIKAGGSSLRDYVKADGQSGLFQNQFAVYGKEGERCLDCQCDLAKTGGIRRIIQGGRSSFFCKSKQK